MKNELRTDAIRLLELLVVTDGTSCIKVYYEFAEQWRKLFPGKQTAKVINLIRGTCDRYGIKASFIYTILDVTKFYPREAYDLLCQRAGGHIIRWSHLKVMTGKLKKRPELRLEAERYLVSRQHTEYSLKEWFNEKLQHKKYVDRASAARYVRDYVRELRQLVSGMDATALTDTEIEELVSKACALRYYYRQLNAGNTGNTEMTGKVRERYEAIRKHKIGTR